LSGGEKQRVAIARALMKQAPIMAFDEATSALDTATEKDIQSAINEASKDSTTLMIAHRLSTIRDCDKILVLKNGVIVEQGPHNELLESDGLYKKLWERQNEQSERDLQEIEEKKRSENERKETFVKRKEKRKSTIRKD
jgi:ABC-type multidrug transport system fused ATPase/permease subunit